MEYKALRIHVISEQILANNSKVIHKKSRQNLNLEIMLNPKMSQFTVFVCGSRECGLVTKGRQLFTVVIHDCSPLIHDRMLQRKPQVLVQFSRNRFIVQLIAVFFTEIQVIQSYLELTIKMTNRASTRRSIFLIFGSTIFILFCTGMKQNAAIDEQHLTLIQLISFHPFFCYSLIGNSMQVKLLK